MRAAALLDVASRDNPLYRAQPRIAAASAHRMLGNFADAERLLQEASRILNKSDLNTEADLALVWARLEATRGHKEAAARWFDRAIEISEQLFKRTSTPGYAWGLTQTLETAAAAIPASAQARRQRIIEVWKDQNRRFPGHSFIEQRIAER